MKFGKKVKIKFTIIIGMIVLLIVLAMFQTHQLIVISNKITTGYTVQDEKSLTVSETATSQLPTQRGGC